MMNKFNPANAMALDVTRRRSFRSIVAMARRTAFDLLQLQKCIPPGTAWDQELVVTAKEQITTVAAGLPVHGAGYMWEVTAEDTIEMCGLLLSGQYTEDQIMEFYSLEPDPNHNTIKFWARTFGVAPASYPETVLVYRYITTELFDKLLELGEDDVEAYHQVRYNKENPKESQHEVIRCEGGDPEVMGAYASEDDAYRRKEYEDIKIGWEGLIKIAAVSDSNPPQEKAPPNVK